MGKLAALLYQTPLQVWRASCPLPKSPTPLLALQWHCQRGEASPYGCMER